MLKALAVIGKVKAEDERARRTKRPDAAESNSSGKPKGRCR